MDPWSEEIELVELNWWITSNMKFAQFPQIPGPCEKLASCCFFFPWLFALTRVATCNLSKEQYSPISQTLFTSSSLVLLFLYSFCDCSTSQNFHYFFFPPWRLQTLLKYSLLRCAKAKRLFVQQQNATVGSLSLML